MLDCFLHTHTHTYLFITTSICTTEVGKQKKEKASLKREEKSNNSITDTIK